MTIVCHVCIIISLKVELAIKENFVTDHCAVCNGQRATILLTCVIHVKDTEEILLEDQWSKLEHASCTSSKLALCYHPRAVQCLSETF
jgi:hypothetical protein